MTSKNGRVVNGLAVAIAMIVGLAGLCLAEVKPQPVCNQMEAINLLKMPMPGFAPSQMREFEAQMREDMDRFRRQMEEMGFGHDLFAKSDERHDGWREGRGDRTKRRGHGKSGGDMMGGGGMIRGGGGTGEHSSRWKQHMMERHAEYIKWLEKNYPDEAKRLEKIKKNKPLDYMKAHMGSKRKYGAIMEAEEKNPEWARVLRDDVELKGRRDELLKEYASANAKTKKKLKAELQEIIEARFDIVVKKKQHKYESLKKRLESLRKRVEKQEAELKELQKQKDEATAGRMSELIGSSERIDWE